MTKPGCTESLPRSLRPRDRRRVPLSRRAFLAVLTAGIAVGGCKTIIRPPIFHRRDDLDSGP